MIYWQLLWVYLKIGMFGFGGGYAMLSLIQHEIVDIHHWLIPNSLRMCGVSTNDVRGRLVSIVLLM